MTHKLSSSPASRPAIMTLFRDMVAEIMAKRGQVDQANSEMVIVSQFGAGGLGIEYDRADMQALAPAVLANDET